LIIIIALGESIVALGVDAASLSVHAGVLVAAALGLTVAALPALLSLALVAATTCALITYEMFRYADVRDRIRHGTG
jgi:hypothetical protein